MTLILRRREIEEVIRMKDVIEVVRKSFIEHAKKKVSMPEKVYVGVNNGHFRAMPASLSGSVGIKWASVYPGNRGLHSVMATIIYSDPTTGYPLGIMDGTLITSFRTGAAAAIASEVLARDKASSFGVVGLGEQAYKQLIALQEVFDLNEVRVFDISRDAIENFVEFFSFQDFDIKEMKHLKDAVASDIVSTTTPVKEPLVKAEWVKEGTHINAIGADVKGKQELESTLVKKAKIIVDDVEQAISSGEINVPLAKGIIKKSDIYGTLGEILAGMKKGRENKKEITLFDATGLAIHDIATARMVYEKCKKKVLGTEIDIMS